MKNLNIYIINKSSFFALFSLVLPRNTFANGTARFASTRNINSKQILSYSDAETHKFRIYKDNINKSGIYRWTNLSNGKSYVGSGSNLTKRFKQYYSLKYLQSRLDKSNSYIYNALIKYGHANFKLDILEYCDKNFLIEREQYYINSLIPEYNILNIAGSRLGAVLSDKTKNQISKILKYTLVSNESKLKMSLAARKKLGVQTSFYGKTHSDVTKQKLAEANSILIKVFNQETNEALLFKGNLAAAKYLGIGESTLRRYKLNKKLVLGKYFIFNA